MKYGLSIALPLMMLKRAPLAIPSPPANTVLPVISGSTVVGQRLTCSTGTWTNNPTAYTYQWIHEGNALPGETQNSLLLDISHLGMLISCGVTAQNAGGSTQEYTLYVGPVTDVV